jgi:hypothetical protein
MTMGNCNSLSAARACVAALSVLTVAALAGVEAEDAQAQGCVASRLDAPSGPTNPEGNAYYLAQGKWQATFGYRNYFSHRHFVGDIEQNGSPQAVEGDRSKNPVENHVNIPEIAVTYGFSDRWSATLDLPIEIMERRNPPRAATATSPAVPAVYTHSRGIGDIVLTGNFWLANPAHRSDQNLMLGLGLKLPTGRDGVDGTFLKVVDGQLQNWVHPVDQSIQPGDGGVGIMTQLQAFRTFGPVTAYVSGEYLINPRGTNGVQTGRSDPNEAIMSVADQFGARVAVGMPLPFLKGLAVSLGGRLEGVPASDLIGSSAGFRRPGYSIGIEPAVSYTWGKSSFFFSFPYLVYRNRTQSYADKLATAASGTYTQGDAAFADYIFIAGISKRF